MVSEAVCSRGTTEKLVWSNWLLMVRSRQWSATSLGPATPAIGSNAEWPDDPPPFPSLDVAIDDVDVDEVDNDEFIIVHWQSDGAS
jgi:hypothetical protein